MRGLTKLNPVILAILFHPILMSGTTVVLWFTPAGIVIATDSKATNQDTTFSVFSESTVNKFVIVQGRIVVTTTGVTALGGRFQYNFSRWMDALQRKLPADASVEDVARAIEKESSIQFAGMRDAIPEGLLTKGMPDDTCKNFVEYLVAGYQNSIPMLYEVQYYIDWNTQTLIGPRRIIIEPQEHPRNISYHTYGVNEVINALGDEQSYAYKETMARAPKAFGDMVGKRYLPLDETASIARVLVQIEQEMDPSDVGGEVRIVQIVSNGKADEVKSRTVLPKARKSAAKKQ